ncbi:lysozyme [Rhizobium grahamii]|uniref:Lysozyme n=1 Tax=Rhizobium grahamii CCGE 502 TaxID=990285 RepID=S3I069_9HYPH|nr:lysozyme [Rhizobium grahamii]EPE98626.1 phage related lysozyme protein [Rhizobium grahamii CCGE 502]
MPKLNKKAVAAVAAVALSIGTLIKPWEGLSLTAYPDIVGVWTACYGETQNIRKGMKFTKAECDEKLLTRVMGDYYLPLTECIADFDRKPVEWQAAAISVTYNVGVGAACKSTFARLAREGRIKESCHAMTAFNKAGGRVVQGLVNRRSAELALCLKGVA